MGKGRSGGYGKIEGVCVVNTQASVRTRARQMKESNVVDGTYVYKNNRFL